MMLKMAALPPIPSASVTIAISANPGSARERANGGTDVLHRCWPEIGASRGAPKV